MADSLFFQPINERSPIRQGDLLKCAKYSDDSRKSLGEWHVIVTADCDIAKKKFGSFLTCVPILAAENYLDYVWAAEQLESLVAKHAKIAIDLIYAADRRRDENVSRLRFDEILEWTHDEKPVDIVSAISFSSDKQANDACLALDILKLYSVAKEKNHGCLETIRNCWAKIGLQQEEHKGRLRSALNQGQMRSDFMFIPTLPSENCLGYVILLREICSIPYAHVYPSQRDFKIANEINGYYRIGRFVDFIRFGIAQRLSLVFFRIGMTDSFEEESELAARLASESIIGSIIDSP